MDYISHVLWRIVLAIIFNNDYPNSEQIQSINGGYFCINVKKGGLSSYPYHYQVLCHLHYLHCSCVFVLTTNQHQPFVKPHLSLFRSIKRCFISKQMFCKDFFPPNKANHFRCFLSNNPGSTCTVIFNF